MSSQGFFAGKGEARTFKRKPKEARTADGIVFDSELEMNAYKALVGRVPAEWFHRQEKFLLLPTRRVMTRGESQTLREMTWSADFMIGPPRAHCEAPVGDQHLVVDVKGHQTEAFVVRLKIFQWRYQHIPLVKNTSKQRDLWSLVDLVRQHCEYLKSLNDTGNT